MYVRLPDDDVAGVDGEVEVFGFIVDARADGGEWQAVGYRAVDLKQCVAAGYLDVFAGILAVDGDGCAHGVWVGGCGGLFFCGLWSLLTRCVVMLANAACAGIGVALGEVLLAAYGPAYGAVEDAALRQVGVEKRSQPF